MSTLSSVFSTPDNRRANSTANMPQASLSPQFSIFALQWEAAMETISLPGVGGVVVAGGGGGGGCLKYTSKHYLTDSRNFKTLLCTNISNNCSKVITVEM